MRRGVKQSTQTIPGARMEPTDLPRPTLWEPGTISESVGLWLTEVKGVPRYRVASTIAEALGEDRGLVYRRMHNNPGFSSDELQRLADKMGTSAEILSRYNGKAVRPASAPSPIEGLPCVLSPGLDLSALSAFFVPAEPGQDSGLVAAHVDGHWQLMKSGEAPAGAEQRGVRSIHLRKLGTRVAVIEDDADAAAAMVESLRLSHLNPHAFGSAQSFLEAYRAGERFDAYLFDWILGERDAAMPITVVRKTQPEVPMYVLSGRITDFGTFSLLDFCTINQVDMLAKPIQMSLVAHKIHRALGDTAL